MPTVRPSVSSSRQGHGGCLKLEDEMARLTAAGRRKLPASDFALGKGHYPIEDRGHAQAALGRIKEFGSPAQISRVERAVHRRYPGMGRRKVGPMREGVHGAKSDRWLDRQKYGR